MKSLVVENLSIEFGGVRAVDGVSFEVVPGETFAIIGPNGAGKSTIFNLISRIYEPTGGVVVCICSRGCGGTTACGPNTTCTSGVCL